MNKQFDKGRLVNESSLDFAFSNLEQTKDWTKQLAYLTRAILIDHVFEEGNKRTTAALIMVVLEIQKIAYDPQKVDEIIITILKKNIKDTNKIRRLIKDVTR
mgnify:CR=1 FL=1